MIGKREMFLLGAMITVIIVLIALYLSGLVSGRVIIAMVAGYFMGKLVADNSWRHLLRTHGPEYFMRWAGPFWSAPKNRSAHQRGRQRK